VSRSDLVDKIDEIGCCDLFSHPYYDNLDFFIFSFER
jgi:hypothetical protein